MNEVESKKSKVKLSWTAREPYPSKIVKYLVNITNLRPGTSYFITLKAVSRVGVGTAAALTVVTNGNCLHVVWSFYS